MTPINRSDNPCMCQEYGPDGELQELDLQSVVVALG